MATLGRDRKAKRQVVRTFVVVAIVVALALVLFQTAPSIRGASQPLRAGMDDIVVQSASSTRQGSLFDFNNDEELQAEIERLQVENRQLAIWRDAATSMTERLQRYEELLNLASEPLPQGISARVVTETDGPFAETRLANAGALHGVQLGHVAVNTQGVIGRVIRVGNRSSRILLVTDFNSRVPVMGEISGVRAILAGGSGSEFGQLIDRPEQAPFVQGESIVTSGEGNAFPRGLRIARAVLSGEEWVAQLSLSEAPVDFVRLLPAQTIPTPEEDPLPEPVEAEPEASAEMGQR
ncbi:rod shape-determining protein MreC [Ponticaulis sp.]|uniref:rod shape-determining protein MreC n=1 Tax=Ponticaulis sp. TaxID=2020902 RepID=UPI000B6D9D15|nr:rod shape-determining protein MreC [Ponticaulis sp.]MAJ08944.1 Rod shape-determining protein MreC [Ponticaulis sp.]RPG16740.1 MAG: rod shape-determining protein MreC [Hyphomonadaceae bacterium TMED125]HBH91128.1 Rod shape-determining protein MreC [Hyphomonadaceae bacterium]HBJ93260.1 Rod shape-determining protein MreC [Hyphomonadaceae bacterium]|tara:strand:+ start:19109 stop:19990 length:882 start_codon:yes stop_codon:yes gene_type:complete